MSKSKKSEKKHKRQKTNWALFFRLCKEGRSNEQIAKAVGWPIDPKSADPYKRVRASKSIARTAGIKVDGKLVRLHDRKPKGLQKPKSSATKKTKPKPAVAPPTSQTSDESKTSE